MIEIFLVQVNLEDQVVEEVEVLCRSRMARWIRKYTTS
jgi:hypothetical protein